MKKFFKILFFLIFAFFLSVFFYYQFSLKKHYEVPILMYHSLDKEKAGKYAAVSLEVFKKQLSFIKKHNYKVIPLSEYCQLLQKGFKVPRKTVVITFDDGYLDIKEGLKILKKYNFPVTVFLIVEKIGKQGYLSREDIKEFFPLLEVGSHTLTHRYLPDTEKEEMKREIFLSKKVLEDIFGKEVFSLAYPVGGFNRQALKYVKEANYLCACTTNRGFSSQNGIYTLRRIKMTNDTRGIGLWAKLSGYYNYFKKVKKPY